MLVLRHKKVYKYFYIGKVTGIISANGYASANFIIYSHLHKFTIMEIYYYIEYIHNIV